MNDKERHIICGQIIDKLMKAQRAGKGVRLTAEEVKIARMVMDGAYQVWEPSEFWDDEA